MIKPASEGSSFGMNKVNNESELLTAVEEARKYNSNKYFYLGIIIAFIFIIIQQYLF